jgi:hypothetical protein
MSPDAALLLTPGASVGKEIEEMSEPEENMQCDECRSPDDIHHSVTCSKATAERRAELYKAYYEMMQRTQQHNTRAFNLLRDRVTFWQGKCAILKRENNALRRKLAKLPAPPPHDVGGG